MFPKGGVTAESLARTADAGLTLALGSFASESAAQLLKEKWGVPFETLDLPIGVQATDRFIHSVMDHTGKGIAECLKTDRGRLVDMMCDMQQYLYGTTAALFGDPDQLIALTEFLLSMGMRPKYIITGTPGKRFELAVKGLFKDASARPVIKSNADLFYLHQLIKNDPVDLLIGNTYGKYIARCEDIPLVRFGWPVLDRIGHTYFPTVGYRGGMHLLTQIVNTLLDRKDRDSPEERFELVM